MDDVNSLVRELAFGISNSFGLIGDTVIRAMAKVAAVWPKEIKSTSGEVWAASAYADLIKSQAGLRQWAIH